HAAPLRCAVEVCADKRQARLREPAAGRTTTAGERKKVLVVRTIGAHAEKVAVPVALPVGVGTANGRRAVECGADERQAAARFPAIGCAAVAGELDEGLERLRFGPARGER